MYRNINHLEVTDNETGYCALGKQITMTIYTVMIKKKLKKMQENEKLEAFCEFLLWLRSYLCKDIVKPVKL